MKPQAKQTPDSSSEIVQDAVLQSLLKILDEGLNVTVKANSQAHADLKIISNERKALMDSNREMIEAGEKLLNELSPAFNFDLSKSPDYIKEFQNKIANAKEINKD